MALALMAVRQEVNNFESSVVVQELEFAMNLALYHIRTTALERSVMNYWEGGLKLVLRAQPHPP